MFELKMHHKFIAEYESFIYDSRISTAKITTHFPLNVHHTVGVIGTLEIWIQQYYAIYEW